MLLTTHRLSTSSLKTKSELNITTSWHNFTKKLRISTIESICLKIPHWLCTKCNLNQHSWYSAIRTLKLASKFCTISSNLTAVLTKRWHFNQPVSSTVVANSSWSNKNTRNKELCGWNLLTNTSSGWSNS